jgi:hypothetical protein
MVGLGSADYSPVVYDWLGSLRMDFCRNLFTTEVYTAAAAVLNLAGGPMFMPSIPGSGSWISIRLFPQGLYPVDAALQQLLTFVQMIAEGIQGVTDLVVAYIEFLEARILEMQALVVRLNGLLNILQAFDLPSTNALVVTGNGTQGILQGLVQATNKPSDSSAAYGAGVVLLAGGLPAIALEILQLIISAGAEE